jgi:MFS family permease
MDPAERDATGARPGHRYWRRNLAVAAVGSFTTIVGMTLILPILPLYVRDLGVTSDAAVTTWSGVAYAATFLTAALTAPLWGRLGDRYGRKSMLIRASLGMAVAMSLIGLAQDVYQLVALRLLAGLLGGYSSGSTILVAAQAPRGRSAWALGVLASAIMAGNVIGPLVGGTLAEWLGVEAAFFSVGALIFLAFLATALFLREDRSTTSQPAPTPEPASPLPAPTPEPTTAAPAPSRARARTKPRTTPRTRWRDLPDRGAIGWLLALSALLMFATVSAEPIITVHIERLGVDGSLALTAALVFSLTALGTMLSGPWLGRLADRVGHLRVLTISLACATVLLAAQAVAPNLATFAALRFVTGLALGGITPTVIATIRRLVPDDSVGLVLGSNVSAQFAGQVTGPVVAGALGGLLGTSSVFVMTAVVTALGLGVTALVRRRLPEPPPPLAAGR